MGTGKAILVVICALQLTFCMAAFNSPAAAAPPAAGDNDIAQTVKALKEIKIVESDGDPVAEVPPGVMPLLIKLKHQLRDLITTALASYDDSKSTGTVENVVMKELQRQGVKMKKPRGKIEFADIYPVEIRRVKSHRDLIAATIGIGIVWAPDRSLYIFKKKGKRWDLIMAQEANDYPHLSDAENDFQYYISPPSKGGQFFVASKDLAVSGWMGAWREIRYKVLRPTADPYKPEILLKREVSINVLAGEESFTGLPDGFKITFVGRQSLDAGMTRKHIVIYRIRGNGMQRMAPIAREPEGFLDEWLDSEWKEAAQWVLPSARSGIAEWHRKLREDRISGLERDFFFSLLFSPGACKVGKNEWQVGLEFSVNAKPGPLRSPVPENVYATIVKEKGVYYVKSISEEISEKCQ